MSRVVQSSTDSYEVLRELGRGASGCTSLVRVGSTGGLAVLKELHLQHLTDWKVVDLFQREARLLRSLDHPGIPRYVDAIGEEGGVTALVQTFVEGQTAHTLMDGGAPLSRAELEGALRCCLDILAYLRERVPPVVHRDIAPRNVMLAGGRAFLIDFGSVKWALADSTALTSVGTFGYMAPEQILGRAEPASDMYGLGMTFVALATRRDPARFDVDPATGRVDVRRMLRLPARVAGVLERMTAPGLGERLSDPREALALLDGPEVPATRQEPGHPQSRRRAAVVVLGASGVFLAAGAVVAFMAGVASVGPSAPAASPPAVEAVSPAAPVLAPEPRPLPDPSGIDPEPAGGVEVLPVPVAGTAELTLDSSPQGATVQLPGGGTCTTPCKAAVPYGRHRLRFTHEGRAVVRDLMAVRDTSLLVSF